MEQKDHDKIIGLQETQSTICKKLDYIIDKVDSGFEENHKAHLQITKDVNNEINTKTPNKTFWMVCGALFVLICGSFGYSYLLSCLI